MDLENGTTELVHDEGVKTRLCMRVQTRAHTHTHTHTLLQCLFQSHLLHLPEPKLVIRDIIMVVKLGVVSVRLHVVLFSVLVGRVTDA